jgi:hypothetical protein
MLAGIHQPEHLPWCGLLHKIINVDVFVFLDSVQFKKNYFENRNIVYNENGPFWLTLPIQMKGHISKRFCEMEIVDNWKKKYVESLKQNYRKSPFFQDCTSTIDFIDNFHGLNLAELNIGIICNVLEMLNSKTTILRSSQMDVSGSSTELLVNILNDINANEYLVGKSGFDYMNLDLFKHSNIKLTPHQFKSPQYKHFRNLEITKTPSFFDVLSNIGSSEFEKMLKRKYEN